MEPRPVLFAPEARDDLLSLYDVIARDASPVTAMGYIDRIQAFCLRLDIAPERGRRRDDIRPGLRIVGFERRLVVAFTVEVHAVTILRIFYGGQDWENTMR